MLSDIRSVMWKEFKELLRLRGSGRATALSLAFPVLLMGILLPWQTGRLWTESLLSLAAWLGVPLTLASMLVADAFAGERERNTLETLLATRLPDRAILLGKIAAAVVYGWGATVFIVVLGLVTVNLSHGGEGLFLYRPVVILSGSTLGLLAAGLAVTTGVLFSLHAATVRQAQQSLSFAITLIAVGPVVVLRFLPVPGKEALFVTFMTVGEVPMLLLAGLLLIVFDAALFIAVSRRFIRSKLILD